MRLSFAIAGALGAALGICHAQESRATIIGRATDSTGAVIVGARVQVVNLATNAGAS